MPDLTDFLLYCAYNQNFKYTHLSGSKISCIVNNAAIALIEFYRRTMRKALNESNVSMPMYYIRACGNGIGSFVNR